MNRIDSRWRVNLFSLGSYCELLLIEGFVCFWTWCDLFGNLEMDYGFCQRSPEKKSRYCDDLQFQLAAHKLRHDDFEIRRDGFKLVKQLAERGHGDGMCMYGIVLNEGRVVEADPTQATVWWQRAADMHRHV